MEEVSKRVQKVQREVQRHLAEIIRSKGMAFFGGALVTVSEVRMSPDLSYAKVFIRIPAKFVKHIEDGIYELRTEYEGNIFRTFFIFDKDNLVILFNGFKKKTQKTPKAEIEKAKQIKKAYYEKTCK